MNRIKGTSGNDYLVGTNGKDEIKGGKGRDFIDGRGGDDLLIGGKGRDVFFIDDITADRDRILDFQQGKDVIMINIDVGETITIIQGNLFDYPHQFVEIFGNGYDRDRAPVAIDDLLLV